MFAAAYLNTDELRELHENVLEMLCPHPRKVVWAKDAAVLDNQDAPAKHTCQVHPWPSHLGDEKCAEASWLRGNNLAALSVMHTGFFYSSSAPKTTKEIAKRLAQKKLLRLCEEAVADDEATFIVAMVEFLQRIFPIGIGS